MSRIKLDGGMKMWDSFKKFAFKGNIVDMAVGIIIGGAFGKIVSSLVNDVIMPLFGALTAGADFTSITIPLTAPVVVDGVVVEPGAAIMIGAFLQNIVDFLIIALSIFFILKLLFHKREKLEAEKAAAEAALPKAPTEAELLTQIRDLLKEGANERNKRA